MAEAMFSEDGEVERARLEAHVGEVDAFVSAASKTTRLGLRLALLLVRLSPILLLLRFSLLDRLSLRDRVALLSRLERSTRSRLSLAFIGWRSLMTLIFYDDEAELRQLGYSEARERYKRALAVMGSVTPVAAESGVRLRDAAAERPEEGPMATDDQEVA